MPTAAPQLVATAASSMPHVLRDRAAHVLYVRVLARMALGRAVPTAVRAGLLAVVVEHLVALDCEIRWQDIAVTLGEWPLLGSREAAMSCVQAEELRMLTVPLPRLCLHHWASDVWLRSAQHHSHRS